jgi:hypothetical protein
MALHQPAHNRFVYFSSIPIDFDLFRHNRPKENISASTSPYPH